MIFLKIYFDRKSKLNFFAALTTRGALRPESQLPLLRPLRTVGNTSASCTPRNANESSSLSLFDLNSQRIGFFSTNTKEKSENKLTLKGALRRYLLCTASYWRSPSGSAGSDAGRLVALGLDPHRPRFPRRPR